LGLCRITRQIPGLDRFPHLGPVLAEGILLLFDSDCLETFLGHFLSRELSSPSCFPGFPLSLLFFLHSEPLSGRLLLLFASPLRSLPGALLGHSYLLLPLSLLLFLLSCGPFLFLLFPSHLSLCCLSLPFRLFSGSAFPPLGVPFFFLFIIHTFPRPIHS